jgi:circadian clock protein KaiC
MTRRTIRPADPGTSKKVPTGIHGFDHITRGGLPRGRTSLLMGGPGSGKTIFALQFLVHGARHCNEPGVFVAFEEHMTRIVENSQGFAWGLAKRRFRNLAFMDAQPTADLIQTGDFDLCGMLASLDAQTRQLKARRVVFDALDVVLSRLPDQIARRRELYRLHEWLLARRLTGLLTAKAAWDEDATTVSQPFGVMQFMVDCAVILNHKVILGVSQRNLRVQKYRGSDFEENESPFIIDRDGFTVAVSSPLDREVCSLTSDRVSSGVRGIDDMLGGGYYRGSSVLITGFPGTAKTTLSGAFAEAACRRGERTMIVSFDSDGAEVSRNLASVSIQLAPHLKSGLLRVVSARTMNGSAETLLVRIKMQAAGHRARCLVIDPASTFSKAGNELTAHSVAERLIDWCKAEGLTLVCTSLLDDSASDRESSTPLQISTLADTWIHLNYVIQAGERNRGISIIKSRGTGHSNQVRELLLSNSGIALADVYTAHGEVLMGTLRWEKEDAERVSREAEHLAERTDRARLQSEEAELTLRVKSLQAELEAKQLQRTMLSRTIESRTKQLARSRSQRRQLRGNGLPIPGRE